MSCKYIYGIIEYPGETEFGGGGASAYTVPHRDISAVVGDAPFVDYSTLPKDHVAGLLLRHQRVIESVMAVHAVIPMKLGTFAFGRKEVEDILSSGYTVFKDILGKINGKVEMDVAAVWSRWDSVIKDISGKPGINELKERLMAGPDGVSHDDRLTVGRLIKEALDEERERLSRQICGTLEKLAVAAKAHGLMDETMICNAAFLLDADKKEGFEKSVDELDRTFLDSVNFRCVGPLPPYSFYTAEVKKVRPDEFAWAKERLKLDGGPVTREKVEKAYRRSSFAHHPDTSCGGGEFDEINKAYRLLLECNDCAGRADFGDAPHARSAGPGGDLFLVTIRK